MPPKTHALCLLTRFYNSIWAHFLETFSEKYDIYMVIDDNVVMHDDMQTHNIHIVQIDDHECRAHHYYGSSVASNLKDIVAWDKALYYFNRRHPFVEPYEYVWFLEDDVFLWGEELLHQMDARYPASDLLTPFHEVNPRGDVGYGWNHWGNVIHRIGTPWAHSLVCACRLSHRLLQRIDEYVCDRPLLFIEALYNTLALHHGYGVDTPPELECITYDGQWDESNIVNRNRLYHPVKNMDLHVRLRG